MQGTCRQDVWIVDGICMVAYFQDFQFKRASRSHAKTGFWFRYFGYFFALIFRLFFWRSFFRIFCDFGGPGGSQIGAFLINFDDFFVIGWISENDALARVSARSGRFWGFAKSHIFDTFWGTDFRCFFRTLFFRVLMIFSDFWAPSGLPLDLHWDEN